MKKIGILGFGNMGRAIAEQVKGGYRVAAYDKDIQKTAGIQGIYVAADIASLVKGADILLLAVKPQDFEKVLEECKASWSMDKVLISIAAGITTSYIEKRIPDCRVVRVMPNLPAQVGAGMSCLAQGAYASEEDLDAAEDIFEFVGETQLVEEGMMDAVTAVSGSGPAYVCFFLEKGNFGAQDVPEAKVQAFRREFEAAAVARGFAPDEAARLVSATTSGTLRFLKATGASPAELRVRVTSKGGTTEAALAVLEKGGTLAEAVKAAQLRAGELAKG